MLAVDRLLQIEALFAAQTARIVVIELDEELLRLILYFEDGSNLRHLRQNSGMGRRSTATVIIGSQRGMN